MDVNAKLDKIRHTIGRAQYFSDLGQTGANYTWQLEQAADAFTVLDAHLRAGGRMPDEWNPDYTVGADPEAPARVNDELLDADGTHAVACECSQCVEA